MKESLAFFTGGGMRCVCACPRRIPGNQMHMVEAQRRPRCRSPPGTGAGESIGDVLRPRARLPAEGAAPCPLQLQAPALTVFLRRGRTPAQCRGLPRGRRTSWRRGQPRRPPRVAPRCHGPAGGTGTSAQARALGKGWGWRGCSQRRGAAEGSEERSQELAEGRASGSRAAGEPERSPRARRLTATRGGSRKRHL